MNAGHGVHPGKQVVDAAWLIRKVHWWERSVEDIAVVAVAGLPASLGTAVGQIVFTAVC